jgi:hypothetical protein
MTLAMKSQNSRERKDSFEFLVWSFELMLVLVSHWKLET